MFKKIFKTEGPKIGAKAQKFLDLLKERNVDMTLDASNEEMTSFYVDQKIVNGPVIRVVVLFNNNENGCHQYIFDYLSIEPSQRNDILEIINQINRDYVFTSFYLDDNQINQKNSIDITRVYDPQDVLDRLIIMIQIAKEQYGNFMKLLWK